MVHICTIFALAVWKGLRGVRRLVSSSYNIFELVPAFLYLV